MSGLHGRERSTGQTSRSRHTKWAGLLLWPQGTLQEDAAREAMQAACATPYAKFSNDYMAALARVHCLRRGWALPA